MPNKTNTSTNRYQQIKKATIISALFNLVFSISKITFGYLGHSSALLADGIHSFSDLFSDAIVFLGAYIGNKPADTDHPYGHHRVETLISIVISMILILVGLGLGYDILHKIIQHTPTTTPSTSVLVTALFSIIANEGLFRYMNNVGQRLNVTLIISQAWHHRTDVYVSLLVLFSIIAGYFHLHYIDTIAALIIVVLIIKVGLMLSIQSIKELIDTGVDHATIALLRESIEATPGVVAIHDLRTRLHANMIILDVHILVRPQISVSEGHYIAEMVKARLLKNINKVKDVIVHVDPEDDENGPVSLNLPNRQTLTTAINNALKENGLPKNTGLTIHYLNGCVSLDIYFPLALLKTQNGNANQCFTLIQDALINIKKINKISLYFS